MWMFKKIRNDVECKFFISLLNLIKTCYDNNSIYPEIITGNTFLYKINTLFMSESFFDIWSYDMFRRGINQIPIIDSMMVFHIEFC